MKNSKKIKIIKSVTISNVKVNKIIVKKLETLCAQRNQNIDAEIAQETITAMIKDEYSESRSVWKNNNDFMKRSKNFAGDGTFVSFFLYLLPGSDDNRENGEFYKYMRMQILNPYKVTECEFIDYYIDALNKSFPTNEELLRKKLNKKLKKIKKK